MRTKSHNLQSFFNILFVILLLCFGLSFASANTNADEGNYDFYYQDFVVSAYYSPLPGQTRYMRGNYEDDIRLNGRGTNGADGTDVYMGMLAAPKSYAFGTTIELPGLGIGEVHDRGGAIIEKKDYHRIDVWMGHGDEGLTRALNWGMRSITGKVYFEKKAMAQTLDYRVISAQMPTWVKKAQAAKKAADTFTKSLSVGSIDSQVISLKKQMAELGYFFGETRNNYFGPDLEQAVIRFQQDAKVIASAKDKGAGHVGFRTRKALNEGITEKVETQTSKPSTQETLQLTIQAGLGKDATGDDVRALQLALKGLGFYTGKITGEYSDDMIAAVFAFQQSQSVVAKETEKGAGYFGKKTQAALQNAMKQRQEKIAQLPTPKAEIFEGEAKETFHATARIEPKPDFPLVKKQTISSLFVLGTTSDEVKALQEQLAQQGFLEFKHVTGYYGNITANAVAMAQ